MSEINGKTVIFYMLRKSEEEGEVISAVTKITCAYLHGTILYSTDKSRINKNFRIQKDLVSKFIDEYDFTKSLDSY
jgi:hypothetical protein